MLLALTWMTCEMKWPPDGLCPPIDSLLSSYFSFAPLPYLILGTVWNAVLALLKLPCLFACFVCCVYLLDDLTRWTMRGNDKPFLFWYDLSFSSIFCPSCSSSGCTWIIFLAFYPFLPCLVLTHGLLRDLFDLSYFLSPARRDWNLNKVPLFEIGFG